MRKFALALLIALLAGPALLDCRPQPDIRSACNVTAAFEPMAEERSGRPEYPDPVHKSAEKDARLIFPGPSRNSMMQFPDRGVLPDRSVSFVPKVPQTERGPSCAEGLTYCEDTDNYPSDYIASLLRSEKKMYNEFFGQDMATQLNISQRIDVSDESPLCPSLEQVVYPKTAQNKDDKWLYIVNQDEFVQGIRVEKCIKEAPCALSENLPNGYKTTCRQKYIYRKLVSLNESGRTFTDSFRIPSCCACHFRATSVASRFGLGPGRTRAENVTPAATSSAKPSRRQPKA